MSGPLTTLAERVRARFAERFGAEPEGLWAAPGRVNLIGEHTDYNDGFVLPFALDRQVVVAARRRSDEVVRLHSLDRGDAELALEKVRPGLGGEWPAYAAGSLWSLAQTGQQVGGLDLVLGSDVPVGAGLSSSAAVECATLLAARDLFGGPQDTDTLARLAQRAENDIVGMPCGIMDQMASVAGRAGHALFLDCRTLAAEHVPLDPEPAGLRLVVIDTRASHALADGAYAQRRRSCENAARALGVPALRDVSLEALAAAADRLEPVAYRRARHVVGENARVLAAVETLRAGRLAELGPLLSASHASLRDDFEVSVAELDTAVEAAEDAGALGARMTGAGFGGSALALVPESVVDAVAHRVRSAFAARGFVEPAVFPARPSDGARRLS